MAETSFILINIETSEIYPKDRLNSDFDMVAELNDCKVSDNVSNIALKNSTHLTTFSVLRLKVVNSRRTLLSIFRFIINLAFSQLREVFLESL